MARLANANSGNRETAVGTMLSKICMKFKLDPPWMPQKNAEADLNIEDFRCPPFHRDLEAILHNAKVRLIVCERFIKLCKCMTPQLEAELAAMPYRDFLDTDYWSYLRDYVVMAKGMGC